MRTYRGGESVTQGIYWDRASGEFFQSPAQGTVLPGEGNRGYIRMPAPLVLLLGPLLGLGYVIFLPLVGIVGLLVFAARRLARPVGNVMQEMAQVMVPRWVPGVSYLVRGRKGKEEYQPEPQGSPPKAVDQLLGDLEQELQKRRRGGER